MIKIKNLSKSFSSNKVLDNINLEIPSGTIFGLVGINGAGKSTLLRLISGVYSSDNGEILINDNLVYENINVKKEIFFLPDDPYYSFRTNGSNLAELYSEFYNFDHNTFDRLLNNFKLNKNESINTYSKGMKRQLYVSLAISCRPKYLLLDEAFDGLDPIARLYFKRELLKLVEQYNTTVIISSHALRELEDICDSYGILDNNKILSSGNINDKLTNIYKYQLAFRNNINKLLLEKVEVINMTKEGKVINISFKGEKEIFLKEIEKYDPILVEELKINFEDMFIEEVVSRGYLK